MFSLAGRVRCSLIYWSPWGRFGGGEKVGVALMKVIDFNVLESAVGEASENE
jgi:hypothetical protein